MVTRAVVLLLVAIGLVGCNTTPTINTEVKKVAIPVLYVPEPPTVEKPDLPVVCNEEASDGEIAKCYKAAVLLWQGYSKELEIIIQGYLEASKGSKPLEDYINEKARELAVEKPPVQ